APLEELSLLLPSIRHLYDIVVAPEPRWGRRRLPRWREIDCRLGRVEMWLPVFDGPQPLRPFSLLVRIPKHDPPPQPPEPLPYVLLGTQFLVEYQATLELDAAKNSGKLVIPSS